jgi:hypothetical protein
VAEPLGGAPGLDAVEDLVDLRAVEVQMRFCSGSGPRWSSTLTWQESPRERGRGTGLLPTTMPLLAFTKDWRTCRGPV